MALSIGATVSSGAITGQNEPSGGQTLSHTTDTSTGCLVVVIGSYDSGLSAPTCKWGGSGGTAMTHETTLKTVNGTGTSGQMFVFTLRNPSITTSTVHHIFTVGNFIQPRYI